MECKKQHLLLLLGALCLLGPVFAVAQDVGEQAGIRSALLAKVQEEGSVRVIVGLATTSGFQPEGLLPAEEAVQAQREAIQAAQRSLLASVASFDATLKVAYESIPFLALTVDEAALEFLLASSASGIVTSIEEDLPEPLLLASSIPVIGADNAWVEGFEGSGQAVAILDSGIERTHSFFGGSSTRVVSEACYSSEDLPNDIVPLCPNGTTSQTGTGAANANTAECFSGTGTSGTNLCKHGTHVAGIAAGEGASYSGVAKSSNIIAIQVFTRSNDSQTCGSSNPPCVVSYPSDQIQGLDRVYALRTSYNIAAVNMSLGGGEYTAPCDSSQASRKAIIDNLRSAKIATVIASGNDGYTDALAAPACISTAIGVGATTDADNVWFFSNRASFMDLYAPGEDITSSVPGGSFDTWDGTSMAAPHVTGAWAVLKQAKPTGTVPQILNALVSTGVPIFDAPSGTTKPRIQVDTALKSYHGAISFATSSCSDPEDEDVFALEGMVSMDFQAAGDWDGAGQFTGEGDGFTAILDLTLTAGTADEAGNLSGDYSYTITVEGFGVVVSSAGTFTGRATPAGSPDRIWLFLEGSDSDGCSVTGGFGGCRVGPCDRFREHWDTVPLRTLAPDAVMPGDEGGWILADTVSEFPSCAPMTPHRGEILSGPDSQVLELRSIDTSSGCSDNVWIVRPGLALPLVPTTVLSFVEEGSLTDPQPGSPGCAVVPCGDTVSLLLEDDGGNVLAYVLQRELSRPAMPVGSGYVEILLDPDAQTYTRNLFDDFSSIPAFDPVGAELVSVEFKIQEHGTATIDAIVIGATCYALTRTITGSGSVPTASPAGSSGCSSGQYVAGEVIQLTASPAPGWGVGSWSGTDNNASTSTTNNVTMPAAAHTATVHYVDGSCSVGVQNLVLQEHSVISLEAFEACSSITAGPNFVIYGPSGHAIMRAPLVVLRDGFTVNVDGSLTVPSEVP